MESLFVQCAVRAALIAVVTGIVLPLIGIKPAAARHTAWTGVMLTMLLLPVWTAWGPKTPIRLLPPLAYHGNLAAPVLSVLPSSVNLTYVRPARISVASPTDHHWRWQNLLLVVYWVGACGLLARLAIGAAQTYRLRGRANIQDGQGISSECSSPITVGWVHPVVILPKNWQEWPRQQLDAVLTHEREHVRRRDPLIQWLALVNRAVFWFHPLSWWLERQLSVLAEEACDAAVLKRGHSPEKYSEYLLDLARSVSNSGSRLSIIGMAMPGSLLQRRIRQILGSRGPLPISRTRIVVAVTVCAMSSALLASGTLERTQARVRPVADRLVDSSGLAAAGTNSEIVPAAAQAPKKPRALFAQAMAEPIRSDPPPPPPQTARPAQPVDSAAKDKLLQDAFLRSDPITDMTIAMEVNYFQMNRAEYSVPLTVKIPGSELGLAWNSGAEQTSFDFVGQIRDEFGVTVANIRDKVSINLNGAMAAMSASTPVEYDTVFTLLPGRYRIKLLARNSETGRIGTYETAFTVPNLNKEQQEIPISSVVLSSQRVDVPVASNVGDKTSPANPLVADGRKLVPSVTRVFSKSREMYVYLQAYQGEARNAQPLVASVAFYQGQAKVWETPPIEVTQVAESRSKAVPLSLNISLADLKPGEYTCQITVRNRTTEKSALWQAPVVIEP